MDKPLLQQQVCQRLEADLALLLTAAEVARQAATHEESKAENKYDTRGLEASYLAAGQARRAEEIRRALGAWRTLQMRPYDDEHGIQLGALICLADADDRQQWLLLGSLILGSAIGVFYYLRVMVTLFLAEPNLKRHDAPFNWGQRTGGVMLLFVALLVFVLGVYPQPLLELVQHAGLVAVAP